MEIPEGLTEVSKEEFWARVTAEKRNIHPYCERLFTPWRFVNTTTLWGWDSTGYASPYGSPERYAIRKGA